MSLDYDQGNLIASHLPLSNEPKLDVRIRDDDGGGGAENSVKYKIFDFEGAVCMHLTFGL